MTGPDRWLYLDAETGEWEWADGGRVNAIHYAVASLGEGTVGDVVVSVAAPREPRLSDGLDVVELLERCEDAVTDGVEHEAVRDARIVRGGVGGVSADDLRELHAALAGVLDHWARGRGHVATWVEREEEAVRVEILTPIGPVDEPVWRLVRR